MGAITSYLKHNWTGLLFGVASLFTAYYFAQQSRQERAPTFVVDPNRVEILSAERAATAPIKVLRRDGVPIQGDIYAVRFYIWNAGKLPIRDDDVLDTIRIGLDLRSEILDYKVLRVSRPITSAALAADSPMRSQGHGLRTLAFVFSILEHDDGLTGQVIYEGKRNATLTVSGIVVGAAEIQNPQAPSFWSIARHHRAALVGGGVACVVMPSLAWFIISVAVRRRRGLPFALPKEGWGGVVRLTFVVTLGVGAVAAAVIGFNAWDTPPATVVSMVPERLLP